MSQNLRAEFVVVMVVGRTCCEEEDGEDRASHAGGRGVHV